MRIPLPARIAIYLILAAFLFDFLLYCFSDAEYFYPGIGFFTFITLPIGMLLVIGGYLFMLLEWRDLQTKLPFTSPGFVQTELHLGPELYVSQHEKDLVYPSPSLRLPLWLGVALLLLGVTSFVAINYWMETRTFKPVDMPVSLATGHIHSGRFKINLRKRYWITLDATDYQLMSWNCSSYHLFKTRWVLYRDGKVVEDYDAAYPEFGVGSFEAESGTYDLDVEVLSDGSCLNPAHPRLQIFTSKYEYEESVTLWSWVTALCAAIGSSLIIIFVLGKFRNTAIQPVLTGASSFDQHFQWAQKLPLRPPFRRPPHFGVVAAFVYFVVLAPVWIITADHAIPIGLPVYLLQSPSKFRDNKFVEPIVVQIRDVGPTRLPELYVNSVVVSWEDLRKTLRAELGKRPEWVVYVKADPNIPYANITTVASHVRHLQGKVVLLTPQTEFELKPKPIR